MDTHLCHKNTLFLDNQFVGKVGGGSSNKCGCRVRFDNGSTKNYSMVLVSHGVSSVVAILYIGCSAHAATTCSYNYPY